jgi:hypothetical protein
MSDPTRYRVANNQAQLTLGGNILAVDPAGPLVTYADYASLKAEVERLRKAGDKLVFALEAMDIIMDMDSEHPEVAEWNAAKEGKV